MPAVRTTSAGIETLISPGDAKVRATAAGVETLIVPGDAKIRATAVGIEAYMGVSLFPDPTLTDTVVVRGRKPNGEVCVLTFRFSR